MLSVPSALDRARVLLRHGSLLRRSRRQLRARPVLAEAVRIAEARGALPLAALAREELQAAGGRRHRTGAGAGLTAQETRVARGAATGATMREITDALFVSPRTVETHLANIYRKLGVASKSELRRRQAEFGLDRE